MKNLFTIRSVGAVSVCTLLIALCFAVGVSLAYFADSFSIQQDYDVAVMSSQVYESSLGTNTVEIGTQYTSQSTITSGTSKTLTIQNTSNLKTDDTVANKVLLRVSFGVKVGTSDTNTTDYTFDLVDSTTYTTVNSQTNAGFTGIENGWYYYNAPLLKGQYAPFATFSNTGTNAIHVQLTIEVVQASLDVAQNYWKYLAHADSNYLGDTTFDGITMDTNNKNSLLVFVPKGTSGWQQATSSNSLDASYTTGAESATVSLLNAGSDNSCLRIYNNSTTPIILALRISIQSTVTSTTASSWPTDTTLNLNFANGNSNWIDIRDNYSDFAFDANLTGKFSAFVYDQLVMPGESVYALDKTISISTTDTTSSDTYNFHIVCEIMGYSASESNYVDKYLSKDGYTIDDAGSTNQNSVTVRTDRVPLFYDYSYTDADDPLYSTELASNGEYAKYTNSANFYSQYAIWYNKISPQLSA